MSAAEKIVQDEAPAPKRVVGAQNEQAYSMLGQMASGVAGMPGMKKPQPRKTK